MIKLLTAIVSLLFFFSCSEIGKDKYISLEEIMEIETNSFDPHYGETRFLSNIYSEEYHISPLDSFEAYYFDYKLKQLMCYRNGIRDGIHLEFSENGNLYMYAFKQNGKSNGLCKSYTYAGKLRRVSLFYEGEEKWSQEFE